MTTLRIIWQVLRTILIALGYVGLAILVLFCVLIPWPGWGLLYHFGYVKPRLRCR